jgi:hypothetical protein
MRPGPEWQESRASVLGTGWRLVILYSWAPKTCWHSASYELDLIRSLLTFFYG